MSLGDLLLRVGVQQLVQAELVHAVEVTERRRLNVRRRSSGRNEKAAGLLVAAVPLPGVARFAGQKVGCPLVLHPLGEPQQNPGVVVRRVSGGAAEKIADMFHLYAVFFPSVILDKLVVRGEAVLLCSTAKVVHGHPLHVGASLDVVRIRNQIRETWEQEQNAESASQQTGTTIQNTAPAGQERVLLRELF